MKRFISMMTAMILILAAVCTATAEGNTFTTQYFTLQLPEGWTIDTEDLGEEDGDQELGYFGEEKSGLLIGAYIIYYEDYKDVSLWSMSESELKNYVEDLMDDLEARHVEWIETVMAGNIPIVLLRAEDYEGEFIYAETMTNGYTIHFQAIRTDEYAEETFPLTDEDIETLKGILATFQPVT